MPHALLLCFVFVFCFCYLFNYGDNMASLTLELRVAAEKCLAKSNTAKMAELRNNHNNLCTLVINKTSVIENDLHELQDKVNQLESKVKVLEANLAHKESVNEHLQKEVDIQGDLLKTKEDLLKSKDLMLNTHSATPTSLPTFASAATRAPTTNSVPTNIHQVILKPIQIQGEQEIKPSHVRTLFKNHYPTSVLREKQISVLSIRTGPKAVSVLVEARFQVSRLIADVNSNSEINLMVAASELNKRNPTIKLDNIDPDVLPENLVSQLICDNQDSLELNSSEISLVATKRPPIRNGNTDPRPYTAFLAVSPSMFDKVKGQRLSISHSASIAEESFHVNHCAHCLEYSHATSRCPRNKRGSSASFYKRCYRCSAEFTVLSDFINHCKACNTDSCYHCINLPNSTPNQRNVNHRPLSNQCPIYCDKLNFLKRTTNYDSNCTTLSIRSNHTQIISGFTPNSPSTQSHTQLLTGQAVPSYSTVSN